MFQSTRPQRARLWGLAAVVHIGLVSIHAPAKGAIFFEYSSTLITYGFNPRARKGRDSSSRRAAVWLPLFQSTRPQRARPTSASAGAWRTCVSIHAPAKGATRCIGRWAGRALVSIHAPAKGATNDSSKKYEAYEFQSTRPQRARPVGADGILLNDQFQSTRPQRARLQSARPCATPASFNPRARKGRDWTPVDGTDKSYVSIHAPAKGATERIVRIDENLKVSIHAPAKGATFHVKQESESNKFQSTRPQRARPQLFQPLMPLLLFQSTRPQRARLLVRR